MMEQAQTQHDYDELDLMDIIRTLKQFWKLIAVIFLVTVVIVGSVTYFYIPKKYLSYTLFTLEAEGTIVASFGKVATVKDIVLSNSFLKGALDESRLGASSGKVAKLRDSISIQETQAKNIKMQVVWEDPQLAQEILELIYDQYQMEVGRRIAVYAENKLNVAQEQYARSKEAFDQVNAALADFQNKHQILFLPPQMAILDEYYQDLKAQLANSPKALSAYEELLAHQEAAKTNYIKSYQILEDTKRGIEQEKNYLFVAIEPPVLPEKKHSPSTVKNTAVAGALALFVGVMLAFFQEYLRNYKEREEAFLSQQKPPAAY